MGTILGKDFAQAQTNHSMSKIFFNQVGHGHDTPMYLLKISKVFQ